MAAPSIRGVTVPIITTGAISQPSTTQVGDLVVFFLWSQGANSTTLTHTLQAGFTTIRTAPHEDGTTDGRLSVAYRVATQAGTVAHTPYVVANATASQTTGGAIALTVGTFNVLSAPPNNGFVDTTATAPNPPSLTALTGDYLVFALSAWHVTTAGATVATVMANYTLQTQNASASHVTHLAIASRALTGLAAATEDPAAWTDNVTPNGSISFTFAVRGIVTQTSSADSTGAGVADVSSATRTTFAGVLAVTGGAAIASDGAVTGGGPTVHAAGALAVDGGASAAVSASTRSTFSSVDSSGGAGLVVSSSTRTTMSSVAVSGAAAVNVNASLHTVVAGAVAMAGAGGAAITASVATMIAGAVAMSGVAGVAAAGTRATFSVVASSGGAGVAVTASSRTTFTTVDVSGGGLVSADVSGGGSSSTHVDCWQQDRNRRARMGGRRR